MGIHGKRKDKKKKKKIRSNKLEYLEITQSKNNGVIIREYIGKLRLFKKLINYFYVFPFYRRVFEILFYLLLYFIYFNCIMYFCLLWLFANNRYCLGYSSNNNSKGNSL